MVLLCQASAGRAMRPAPVPHVSSLGGRGVLFHWALCPAHSKYLFIFFLNCSFYSNPFRNNRTKILLPE